MRGVHCIPETIYQLTTYGPWDCVELMSHPSGLSLVTSTTLPEILLPRWGSPLSTWHHIQWVFVLYLIPYVGLRQEHCIIVSQMHHSDRLWQYETAAVPDIIHPEFQPGGGEGFPELHQHRCHVESVFIMVEWLHEAYRKNEDPRLSGLAWIKTLYYSPYYRP